ncbi:TPA: sensor histidine kinase [Streptococcus agalactiae]
MFRNLRLRFIGIAALAILVVLFSVVGVLNSANHYQTKNEIYRVLTILADNNGRIPNKLEFSKELGDDLSTDAIFQFRYFSARTDAKGNVTSFDSRNIFEVSDRQIKNYAKRIVSQNSHSGHITYNFSTYSYLLKKVGKNDYLVVFLDTTNQYLDNQRLLQLSIWMSLVSFIVFMVIVSVLSGRVILPFVANYEKQRRFITNAGHELKTPLAIISANNELVEMMSGESEWTKSTNDQIQRLTGLINGMVSLARFEEQPDISMVDLDFSHITKDAAEDFKGPIIKDGKDFIMSIQPGIHVKAEEKSLFELVTLLVDNANKYCDPMGTVTVKLSRSSRLRRAMLEVSNTYKNGKDIDYSKFFERFYREDESHNNKKSGYGIGLSIVTSLVHLFKGSIDVNYKHDTITFVIYI